MTTTDPRDVLWNAVYDTHYECQYEELLGEHFAKLWTRVDTVTGVVTALVASGSAIAGWALWEDEDFKLVWVTIAGTAAVLSLIHTKLDVAPKISNLTEVGAMFSSVKQELEILRHRMLMEPMFAYEGMDAEYVRLRKRYGEAMLLKRTEVLETEKLRNQIQDAVDALVQEFQESGDGEEKN